MGRRPDDARAARAEDPLVAARHEEVGAELDGRGVLHAEAVHPVDAEEDPLVVVAASVRLRHRIGDLAERQLDAG
jgi:hypothetical protein